VEKMRNKKTRKQQRKNTRGIYAVLELLKLLWPF